MPARHHARSSSHVDGDHHAETAVAVDGAGVPPSSSGVESNGEGAGGRWLGDHGEVVAVRGRRGLGNTMRPTRPHEIHLVIGSAGSIRPGTNEGERERRRRGGSPRRGAGANGQTAEGPSPGTSMHALAAKVSTSSCLPPNPQTLPAPLPAAHRVADFQIHGRIIHAQSPSDVGVGCRNSSGQGGKCPVEWGKAPPRFHRSRPPLHRCMSSSTPTGTPAHRHRPMPQPSSEPGRQ